MTAQSFRYICTRTTADSVIPSSAPNQAEFNRKVVNFSRGLVGGVLRAGDLKDRPVQTALANHLLCDGSLLSPTGFPELFAVLGTTFGGNGTTTFALPNYVGAATITAPTVVQTVSPSGTVDTGGAVVDAGGTGGTTGGNAPSGGRVKVLTP